MITIDIDKTYLELALDMKVASLKRAQNAKGINPAMKELLAQDIKIYNAAAATIKHSK